MRPVRIGPDGRIRLRCLVFRLTAGKFVGRSGFDSRAYRRGRCGNCLLDDLRWHTGGVSVVQSLGVPAVRFDVEFEQPLRPAGSGQVDQAVVADDVVVQVQLPQPREQFPAGQCPRAARSDAVVGKRDADARPCSSRKLRYRCHSCRTVVDSDSSPPRSARIADAAAITASSARDPLRSSIFRPRTSSLTGETRLRSRRRPEASRTRMRAHQCPGDNSVSIGTPGTPIGRGGLPRFTPTLYRCDSILFAGVQCSVQSVYVPTEVLSDPLGLGQPRVLVSVPVPPPQHLRMHADVCRTGAGGDLRSW
ncbi:hypothetical protein ABIA39_009103 [Nocardia sp. GAS34]